MTARSTLEDLAAIVGAATPDRLWRHLVRLPSVKAHPNDFEAMVAFRQLHKDGAGDALRTAGLLCTDARWRRVTSTLIVRLEESGILSDPQLDTLAAAFLWEDNYSWSVPAGWLRDGTVRVPHHRRDRRQVVVVDRTIPPPLRRWAAARIAGRRPDRSAAVLARVQGLEARASDAAMTGLLDACPAFPGDAHDAVIKLGCSWPGGSVRLRALQLLARDDLDMAVELATHDASSKVQQWAEQVANRRLNNNDTNNEPSDIVATGTGGDGRPESQLSFFR
jgi:hypothetical protein